MKKIMAIGIICIIFLTNTFAQNKIVRETFVFSTKDGQELKLDKFVDSSLPSSGKRPAIIYIHGGGFSMGSRINALQMKYSKHFATQGFVSISIDYRLGVKAGVQPDRNTLLNAISLATEDLFNATSFILSKSKEWNIDAEKILISGGSAGAITCLNAEYEICTNGQQTKVLPRDFNYAGIISHAGCVVIPKDSVVWQKLPCPILLMHGDKDAQVPFDNYKLDGNLYAGSNYIHKQLIKLGVAHWLYIEAGADHIVALKPLQYNLGEIDVFVDKYVMQGEQAIVTTTWADKKPDSMADMQKVVPLYISGWDKTDEEVESNK